MGSPAGSCVENRLKRDKVESREIVRRPLQWSGQEVNHIWALVVAMRGWEMALGFADELDESRMPSWFLF